MPESIVLDKAIKFALRIVKLYRYLTEEKKEFVLSKLVLVSGTHVAKHARVALAGQGRQHFADEMLKAKLRAVETEFWLFIIHEGGWIDDGEYRSINDDCVELVKMTSSISKTSSESE